VSDLTPMFKQYLGMKSAYPDAILFFRMGDFYEMFFEDAKKASRLLGITLTARGTLNGEKVPMCGVPHHSSKSYVAKLIENGCKVAICEQVEDPQTAKGIVKRDVIRVVTPGSVLEDGEVDSKSNLYMAALAGEEKPFGLAHLDLSTGEFRVTEIEEWEAVLDELGRIKPAELLVLEQDDMALRRGLSTYRLEVLAKENFHEGLAESLLKSQLGVRSLASFGCEDLARAVLAAGALIHYVQTTQKVNPDHIKDLVTYRLGEFMFLDEATTANLELFRTVRRQSVKGSLFQILDRTVTPMGSRQLRKWIGYPLLDLREIRLRLAAVASFRDDRVFRDALREHLDGVLDMERLNARISMGRANARDLAALKQSSRRLPAVKERLAGSPSERLQAIAENLDLLEDVAELIERAICEDPPVSLKEGGLIREGYHEALDRLIAATRDGKTWIADLAAAEQKRTGISSL